MSSSAPGAVRSKQGCWTCRLRKKKCDERHPSCSKCSALAVPCHGYGPKPLWMDGGAEERKMALGLRCAVKLVTNRKRQLRLRNGIGRGKTSIENGQDAADSLTDPEMIQASLESETSVYASAGSNLETLERPREYPSSQNGSVPPTLPNYPGPAGASSNALTDIDEDEGCLLMHYLDHVFPLQFPFYKPSVTGGGRGWLLIMLMRTKPLYHAALSLALWHWQLSIRQTTGRTYKNCCFEVLEKRHLEAISELRYYLEGFGTGERSKSLTECVEVLACMVLLISSEVFRGENDSWELHLRAASALIPTVKSPEMVLARAQLSPAYTAALHFFTGVITWYDILSCATTGVPPFTQCERVNEGLSCVQLKELMGCENWVMLAIMDISMLSEWKSTAQKSGTLSIRELVTQADRIQKRLEEYVTKEFQEEEMTGDTQQGPRLHTYDAATTQSIASLITKVFASAALVHLHILVSGPHPDLPEIHSSVTRIIDAIRTAYKQSRNSSLSQLPTSQSQDLIRSLKWPICIAAPMASLPDHQHFFRSLLLQAASAMGPAFGNWDKILAVLEECWSMRKRGDVRAEGGAISLEWRAAMRKMGWSILLV